jgi:hypothetical protein
MGTRRQVFQLLGVADRDEECLPFVPWLLRCKKLPLKAAPQRRFLQVLNE